MQNGPSIPESKQHLHYLAARSNENGVFAGVGVEML
jgi:hypothetical protein